MRTAGGAAAKERNRMPLNREIRLLTERGELFGGNADINIDHAVTGSAGQVMVMFVSAADPVAVRAIGKLDAVEQASIDQHFHRTIDGCAPQARLALAQILPEVIHRKIAAAVGQFDQTLSNGTSWASCALAFLVKHGVNLFCNHG